MTAKNKKSFLLHIDSLSVLDDLTDEQAGQLLKAISAYQQGEEISLNPIVRIAFSPFKNQFMRDDERYEKTCERRAKAGALGGRAKAEKSKQDLANASNSKQDLANVADNKNKNKTNNKNKTKSDNEDIADKPQAKRFAPPTYQEAYDYFGAYAMEKGITIAPSEPQSFIDFYQSKNWYVGKNKMKDWKASVRNWFKNIEQRQAKRPMRQDVNSIDHTLPEGFKF